METNENHKTFPKPGIYITQIKLKRVVKELSDMDIEEILDKEMTTYAIKLQREKLILKIERLADWQLFQALNLLLTEGRIEAISFVAGCKRSNKESK